METLAYGDGEAGLYAQFKKEPMPSDALLHEALLKVGVKGKRVLDYGCGDGRHLPFLVEQSASSVTGCDPSEGMINGARLYVPKSVVLDVLKESPMLPYADGSFDIVLSSFVFHYIVDTKTALAEIARVLSPGGYLVAIFSDVRFKPGFEHLGNSTLPLIFNNVVRVDTLAKPGAEVVASAEAAGLHIERYDSPPNATIAKIPEDYAHKDVVSLEVGFLVAHK